MGKRVIPGSLGPIRWFTRAIPGAILTVVGLLWVVGSLGVLLYLGVVGVPLRRKHAVA